MIKIIIADDHPIVRQGLEQIIETVSDIGITAQASDGYEMLEQLRKQEWDVAVMDISMPGINGLDLLKQILREFPERPILILSMHPEEQYALRFLKAGASGYLTKETAPQELIAAVKKVYGGGKYISNVLAEKIALEFNNRSGILLHEKLSDREFQVMRRIAAGKKLVEIAEDLSLSVKTISTYRSRILEKMNMKTNAEIVAYVVQNNLID